LAKNKNFRRSFANTLIRAIPKKWIAINLLLNCHVSSQNLTRHSPLRFARLVRRILFAPRAGLAGYP
jgi:hypothetical protein